MRLFLVVGPSGAGKDTLLAGAMAADPRLHWARRVITRPESAGGEPFEGATEAEFAERLAQGEFALHWDAHGLRYGVPFAELPQGRDVIVNGSRAAIPQALPQPIRANLFRDDDAGSSWSLHWSRPRPREDRD